MHLKDTITALEKELSVDNLESLREVKRLEAEIAARQKRAENVERQQNEYKLKMTNLEVTLLSQSY
jgi:hypothetical protein